MGSSGARVQATSAFMIVALGVALALAGCGDDVVSTGPGETGPADGPIATTATQLPPEGEPAASTPESAAQDLLDAWAAGDRAAAEQVAAPDAVEALFASGLDPLDVLFRGCRADPELRCIALLPANRQITFMVSASAPPVVTSVTLPPAVP